MRPLLHPNRDEIELATILYALGDPLRLTIVHNLWRCGELSCSAALPCELPKSTRSHHFRLLREAGLIETRKEGIYALNRLRLEDIEERFPGLLAAILNAVDQDPTA